MSGGFLFWDVRWVKLPNNPEMISRMYRKWKLWNKLKFSPCKNSVLDPWSNRRQSPRQHVNYHGIMTGHSCEINQIILCSSRVFVCWVGEIVYEYSCKMLEVPIAEAPICFSGIPVLVRGMQYMANLDTRVITQHLSVQPCNDLYPTMVKSTISGWISVATRVLQVKTPAPMEVSSHRKPSPHSTPWKSCRTGSNINSYPPMRNLNINGYWMYSVMKNPVVMEVKVLWPEWTSKNSVSISGKEAKQCWNRWILLGSLLKRSSIWKHF